ncbi:uncharacterized protein LOC131014618 [Salvia miltiorrhiza]|uniref:uncharacterized protein LOC131014618 n=1 Tax=Salvia miltiorrhiza TaxID=226208 RepID=UPI0025ABEE06|nr:uncharacterized protein LOC131014618 [Salvia miltiorrhiza]XP_057798623.1 uncharacterized protein LOC131014618 [Salvia miltiorrhiza]
MEDDKGIKLEEQENGNCFGSGECFGCFDLQDKMKKANDKCANLEIDIGKKNSIIERLECKVGFMELENIEFLDEVRKLKQRNEELEKSIRDSEEEQEKFTHLMIENEVLLCEKRKAESDLERWKLKCKEMEAQVMELEKKLATGTTKAVRDSQDMCSGKINHRGGSLSGFNVEGGQPSALRAATENEANNGRSPASSPSNHYADTDGLKGSQKCLIKSRVRKCLDFAAEISPLQKSSPSSPGSRPPLEPIYVGDSDDDLDIVHVSLPAVDCDKQRKVQRSSGVALESVDVEELPLKNMHGATAEHQSDEEETSCSTAGQPFRMHKRRKVGKVVAQIVSSESESDDKIPISRLARRRDTQLRRKSVNDSCSGDNPRKVTPRRRLLRVGDIKDNSVSGKCSQRSSGNQGDIGISENMNDTLLEDEIEQDESTSEGESLGGFIVDVSDCDSGSNCNDMSEHDGSFSGDSLDKAESASECSIGYDKIISSFRRGRKDKLKWEYESDMLADFGKSAELCMKAICALYRQQTSEEKSYKATIHRNGRGFNQMHAPSGSALAEFLTDGNPHADMNKTVEELQNIDPKGVEQCRKLATHYSKQLFEIYKQEEDPFFRP